MSVTAWNRTKAVAPAVEQQHTRVTVKAISLVTVIGGMAMVCMARALDTDLWWHLRAGAYMVQTHAVPTRDFLSFTLNGHAWTDFEWLSELIMYGIYRATGTWGLQAAFMVIIVATFLLTYVRTTRMGVGWVPALAVLAAAFVASSTLLGARPQIFTLLMLAIYGLLLDTFRRTKNRKILFVFPALMVVWVNLHGGFVLGIALLAITLAGQWLNTRAKLPDALSGDDLWALLAMLGATISSTILNPAGVTEVVYPLKWLTPSMWSNVITEWASTNFHQPTMMIFELLVLLLVGSAIVARPRLNFVHILLILAFTHLAISQIRNVAVWCVLISPIAALYFDQALNVLAAQFQVRARQSRASASAGKINVTLLGVIVCMYGVVGVRMLQPSLLRHYARVEFPAAAITYLQDHRMSPNIFASYAWGGYVTWTLYPHYRDFIDGRANTLFDTKVLSAYLGIYDASQHWRPLLNRYHVDEVLVEPAAPIAQVLAADDAWKCVFHDPQAVLYARTSHLPATVPR